jgi:hypothetical protein
MLEKKKTKDEAKRRKSIKVLGDVVRLLSCAAACSAERKQKTSGTASDRAPISEGRFTITCAEADLALLASVCLGALGAYRCNWGGSLPQESVASHTRICRWQFFPAIVISLYISPWDPAEANPAVPGYPDVTLIAHAPLAGSKTHAKHSNPSPQRRCSIWRAALDALKLLTGTPVPRQSPSQPTAGAPVAGAFNSPTSTTGRVVAKRPAGAIPSQPGSAAGIRSACYCAVRHPPSNPSAAQLVRKGICCSMYIIRRISGPPDRFIVITAAGGQSQTGQNTMEYLKNTNTRHYYGNRCLGISILIEYTYVHKIKLQ